MLDAHSDGAISGQHDAMPLHNDAGAPDGTNGTADRVPVPLATGQHLPNSLVVDAANVYWTTSDGLVAKAPLLGGEVTVLASGQANAFGVAVDANSVYWVNSTTLGQVMSVPITGGTPTLLADGQPTPFRIAIDGEALVWTNFGDGSVMAMSVHGGPLRQLANRQGVVVAIAIEAHTVYWCSIGQRAIRSRPLDESAGITELVTEQATSALFIVDSNLYWANFLLRSDGGDVFKYDGQGVLVKLATSPDPFMAVADRLNVYWSDAFTGTIRSVPVDGGEAVVIATEQPNPTDLMIDDENIYWINASNDGAIMKLAKSGSTGAR